MIICSSSNIDLIQGVLGYGNPEGITDWRIANTLSGANGNLNIFNSISQTSRLTILENGNVGIGNTNPGSIMDIVGDVNITGVYKKGNRDIISDTSNYIAVTSNILVSRVFTEVGHGSNYTNRLITALNTRVDDTSNYVVSASNVVTTSVNSQWMNVSSGIYYTPTTAESLPYAITSSPVATTVGATGDYTYMSFTYTTETAGTGSGQTQYTLNMPSVGVICDILVVGGGGAGGGRAGGGGGAGGVLYREGISLSGSITIKVGNGGANGGNEQAPGLSGYNSSIGDLYIVAGGGGGGGNAPHLSGRVIDHRGKDGGSGGGNSATGSFYQNDSTNGYNGNPNTFIVGKTLKNNNYSGNNGGKGISDGGSTWTGGGGGGAGASGGNAGYNSKGGDGIPIRITGSLMYYGGGGGGGANNASAIRITDGGLGGGGNGTAYAGNGFPGISGTGGGGGGGGFSSDSPSGSGGVGGSGIVIIRYLSSTKNVGIGIANPSTELHVYDDTINNTIVTVQNDYIDPVVIYPNTAGYTAVETVESGKLFRTLTFNYIPNYPEDPPNTSLLAWYRFDGDGLDYNPYATKYNLIANTGTPTYSSGTTADSFLQGRRYINTAAGSVRTTTLSLASRAFSIAVWLRTKNSASFSSIGPLTSIINQGNASSNTSIFLGYLANNAYYLAFIGNDLACGSGVSGSPTSYASDLNTWVHIVYVVLPNYNRRIYRNGVLISTDSNTTSSNPSGDLRIGADYNNNNVSLNTDISDLRIYSTGLSATEVATLYASYTNLVITDNYAINFNKSTTLLVNSVSKTVNGLYNLSMGHINSSMLPTGGQTDIPLASTAITSVPIKYEYTSTSFSLPSLITVAGATSSIIGTTERAISFAYTSDSAGLTGQTQYTFTPTEDIWCDILVVGGGGGGGKFGGGGGGGGVLLGTNLKINSGSSVSIKVAKGGTGATVNDNGVNGTNGFDSSIAISSIEYIAKGGGGGGSRAGAPNYIGTNGTAGGSGGGGGTTYIGSQSSLGGVSNKNNYANFQSFGNDGGKGRPNATGSDPAHSSGGGGGAGSVGSDFSSTTGGGNGGLGKEFITYFGTNVGHNGYFAGGGGGNTYAGTGNRGYGNGSLGFYGGGGNGGYDGTIEYFAEDGLPNTGGGGGGGKYDGGTAEDLNGGNGGTGFVIIRYRKNQAQSSSFELITSSSLSIIEPVVTSASPVQAIAIGTTDKYLLFPYIAVPDLIHNFTDFNTEATWKAKADSIQGFTYNFQVYFAGYDGLWSVQDNVGYIEYQLPSAYNNLTVDFGNIYYQSEVRVLINGVVKKSATASQNLTHTQSYNVGDILRIEELYAIMNANIIITLTKTTTQTSYTVNFPENTLCDILVVGGGGGGGVGGGGGGGAGGVVYKIGYTINAGSYIVSVGNGGIGGNTPTTAGSNGVNSTFGNLFTALGGGGGGGDSGQLNGLSGGSGGGAGDEATAGLIGASTQSTSASGGYGNAGGNASNVGPQYGGGGGGGAGSVGGNGSSSNGGAGGVGIIIDITGSSVYYAGGGAGGTYSGAIASGGLGGGGNTDQSGSNNTGGGGGSKSGKVSGYAGSGGSGIVIIRYKNTKIGTQGYKIGNYNGDFKIISTNSSTNTDYLRITRDGASIYNPTGSPLWSTTSDKRIKENIEKASYDTCYDNINKLDLYRFNYIKDFNNINKDLRQLGYIAQEVQGIFPKAVSTEQFNNNNLSVPDLLTIDITQINYSLYGTVKKLMEMYNDIENQISIVENLLNIDDYQNKE